MTRHNSGGQQSRLRSLEHQQREEFARGHDPDSLPGWTEAEEEAATGVLLDLGIRFGDGVSPADFSAQFDNLTDDQLDRIIYPLGRASTVDIGGRDDRD